MSDTIKDALPLYDVLTALPENMIGEIVGGELYSSPRPASRHSRAAGAIFGTISGPFDRDRGGPGGWWILFEPELHLGSDVLVPDLAGWRRKRMPQIPDVAAFDMVPDWVCEVISPSTGRLDRTRKLPVYAREMVGHLWIVDPISKTLERFVLAGGSWLLQGASGQDDLVRAEPFEAIEIDLSAFWID